MFPNLARIAIALVLIAAGVAPASAQPISIGLPPSLTQDMTTGQLKFLKDEFPVMVKDFSGLDSTVARRKSIDALGDSLASGADQFAIMQGVEYGWLKAKHPEIEPLLLGVYHVTRPKALLLTKKDDPAMSFADLKGRPLSLLRAGKEYIYLFEKKGAGGDPKAFFSKILDTSNAETALDNILLGKVAAAIVDQASLDNYKDVNPGRFARLRTIEESAPFPPMAVFYVPGKVPEETVQKFRKGMLAANDSSKSRDAMSTFKITGFEAVPEVFSKWVTDIVKDYPEPKTPAGE
jgi:ABC-type phosphate/phosphonate transport system substrate-binding protein